jgi:hypothetical protein
MQGKACCKKLNFELHQWCDPECVVSHVAELPRPRDFALAVIASVHPLLNCPDNHRRGDIPFGPTRGPRARRDPLRLGEARASCSAKAAFRGRAGSHVRQVANPRTIPSAICLGDCEGLLPLASHSSSAPDCTEPLFQRSGATISPGLATSPRDEARRIAVNIAKLPGLQRPHQGGDKRSPRTHFAL